MVLIKNRFRICIALVIVAFSACDNEPTLFDGPPFVRFTSEAETLRESFSKVINVEVHVVGPAPEKDLTVRYNVSGNAREGIDYVIVGEEGNVVIPKGKYFGNIQVQLINNSNNIIRSQQVIFTITSVSGGDVEAGQDGGKLGSTFTLTITDDCILGGNYKGQQSAFSIPVEGITITSEDCETYVLSNWNINFSFFPFDFPLTFIDNGDNSLTIPQQEGDFGDMKGYGSFDYQTRELEFTIQFLDEEDIEDFTFTLIPD